MCPTGSDGGELPDVVNETEVGRRGIDVTKRERENHWGERRKEGTLRFEGRDVESAEKRILQYEREEGQRQPKASVVVFGLEFSRR